VEEGLEQQKGDQIGSTAALDQILNEAEQLGPGPGAQPGEQGPEPTEEKKTFVQPEGAFDATHEMIVNGIKTVLKKYPGGDKAGAVWESPLFKDAIIPVMKKYNISIYNLPCEIVLFGVIIMLARECVEVMRAAAATNVSKT